MTNHTVDTHLDKFGRTVAENGYMNEYFEKTKEAILKDIETYISTQIQEAVIKRLDQLTLWVGI